MKTTNYFDATVFIRRLTRQPQALAADSLPPAVASELLRVEVARMLHRFLVTGKLLDRDFAEKVKVAREALATMYIVPVGHIVLERAAGYFATPLGALDAIHLATALLWREQTGSELVFLTYDQELAAAARASGLEVP